MSWRDNFRASTEASSLDLRNKERDIRYGSGFEQEIDFLLAQIGDRDAVIDACLPPQLVQDLRSHNVNAIWVPGVLGDGVSDDEIERQLLLDRRSCDAREKVLLTRDVEFYRRIRNKAILVSFTASSFLARRSCDPIWIRERGRYSRGKAKSFIESENCSSGVQLFKKHRKIRLSFHKQAISWSYSTRKLQGH